MNATVIPLEPPESGIHTITRQPSSETEASEGAERLRVQEGLRV
jgi:hypothetical protein